MRARVSSILNFHRSIQYSRVLFRARKGGKNTRSPLAPSVLREGDDFPEAIFVFLFARLLMKKDVVSKDIFPYFSIRSFLDYVY